MSDSSTEDTQTIKCADCGNHGVEADDGVCVWCADPDPAVKSKIRDELETLVEEHGLATVFWSLDAVYDEYDSRFGDMSKYEVPVYEAKVVVPDQHATSGERYETRRVEACFCPDQAREQVQDNPEVREVEHIEQIDTQVVS